MEDAKAKALKRAEELRRLMKVTPEEWVADIRANRHETIRRRKYITYPNKKSEASSGALI